MAGKEEGFGGEVGGLGEEVEVDGGRERGGVIVREGKVR